MTHPLLEGRSLVARAGEYVLQRRTPFTPGYELVGEVVDGADDELPPGTRVAAAPASWAGARGSARTAPRYATSAAHRALADRSVAGKVVLMT